MKAQPVSSTSLMNMLSSCESDVQDLGKSSKCIINMHPNSQKYNMMVEEYDSNHDDLWGTSGMLYQTIQSSDEEETSRCSSRESSCSSQRAKLKNLAVYKVTFNPRIVVRDQPNLYGQVVGVLRLNDFVEVCAVSHDGDWLRIRNSSDIVGIPPTVTSTLKDDTEWIMKFHPEFGNLLEFIAGSPNLPQECMALPAPAPSIVEHHAIYTVVYDRVIVRSEPNTDSEIVSSKRAGDYVKSNAMMGRWIRINFDSIGNNREGWMLTTHHSLGPLLRFHADVEQLN